jgi:hypothetical protein
LTTPARDFWPQLTHRDLAAHHGGAEPGILVADDQHDHALGLDHQHRR